MNKLSYEEYSRCEKDYAKYKELVMAIFDRIESEYRRAYWNANQRNPDSPFVNSGGSYSNECFLARAYDWGYYEGLPDTVDESDRGINFIYNNDFFASWYKHAHRGLFFWRKNCEPITEDYLNTMLNECLESIENDENLQIKDYDYE